MGRTLRITTPEWAVPLLGSSRYKGIYGGRGSGKSHFAAEAMIEAHIMDPNMRSVCIREFQRSIGQSVKRLLEDKIVALGAERHFEVQQTCIKSCRGDGLIIFEGMQNHTADSIKSLEGYDRAWVEEAQCLSQRSLDMLRPTIRKETVTPDGIIPSQIWFTWNPEMPDDPVDRFFRDQKHEDAVVVEVSYAQNPWFPTVLQSEMQYDQSHDLDRYRHVWLGDYAQRSEARVFRNWRVDDFGPPPRDAALLYGADWGAAADPTVLTRCYILGRTLYVDYEAYMIGCSIADIPALFCSVPDAEKWPIVADSARPDTIAYMRKHGFPKIVPAAKGPRSVEEGVEFLRGFNIIIHPRCVHVIDEMKSYSYRIDPLTGRVLPIFLDANNHAIDSLRYACETARRISAAKPIPVTLIPSASIWEGHNRGYA